MIYMKIMFKSALAIGVATIFSTASVFAADTTEISKLPTLKIDIKKAELGKRLFLIQVVSDIPCK